MAVGARAMAWLAASLVVAGCADAGTNAGAPPTPSDGNEPGLDARDPFDQAAAWLPGQWWRYGVTVDGNPQAEPDTRVVTSSEPGAYVVDTTRRDTAAFDAEFDVSNVGPIRASDLAGRQGEDVVEYFRFPLTTGAAWTTRWDGVDRSIRAVGPHGNGFELEALEGERVAVRYSYDHVAGNFGHLDFLDGNGSIDYGLTLVEHGVDFQGTYVRVQLARHIEETTPHVGVTSAQTFELPSGVDELLVRYELHCAAPGAWAVEVASFNAAVLAAGGHREAGPCPDNRTVEDALVDPFSGTWRYVGLWGLPPGGGYHLAVLARSYLESSYP